MKKRRNNLTSVRIRAAAGQIVILGAMLLFGAAATQAATYTVISNADTGAGTLRQAILDSNGSAGTTDTIIFSGVTSIALATPLPPITDPVTIDGGATPTVELNGLATQPAGPASIGLWVRACGGTGVTLIRGLVINRFGEAGIRLDADGSGTDNGCQIIGNRIGTDTAGNAALPNVNRGILVVGTTGHLIGDPTAAPGSNQISGNSGRGIDVNAGGQAFIYNNLIGTDAAGTGDLGNLGHGIQVVNSSNSLIGNPNVAGARNIISGNNGHGVFIIGDIGTPASTNSLYGNYIGVDVSGNLPLGNSGSGVVIHGSDNTVGGNVVGARNVISGNAGSGVSIGSSLATGNTVAGNYIGVGANGTTAIANNNNGVEISNNATGNHVGGTDTTAGLCDQSCNLIANNGDAGSFSAKAGVYIDTTAGVGNDVQRNSIFNNGSATGLGIDLGAPGATANDANDPDAGPNNLQNKPVITSAASSGSINGTLNSTASTGFTIDFYRNTAADGAASEARTYIGSTNVTTDGAGNVNFTFAAGTLTLGQFITATATRVAAPFDTSEISDPRIVTGAPTAAGVSLAGRVVTSGRRGIRSATVTIQGPSGRAVVVRTNSLGYYRVANLPVGASYVVSVKAAGYRFTPRVVQLSDSVANFDFAPQ